MTDLTRRLRTNPMKNKILREAADEIERLRAIEDENERLRLRVKFLEDELKCPAALEPKP